MIRHIKINKNKNSQLIKDIVNQLNSNQLLKLSKNICYLAVKCIYLIRFFILDNFY